MLDPGLKAGLFVVSHKRANNVKAMQALIGQATWVVGQGEGAAYSAQGAADTIEAEGLCRARNTVLDWSLKADKPAIQISDDLRGLKHVAFLSDGQKEIRPISFRDAALLVLGRLRDSPFALAGVAPTSNAFFTSKPVQTRHFVVGDFLVTKPGGLRFDERMTLKEDYDFTLEHIRQHGGVLRCDDILCSFLHYKNAGGAVDVRDAAEEAKNIALLKRKWPSVVRDNPRRPNEILLKLR